MVLPFLSLFGGKKGSALMSQSGYRHTRGISVDLNLNERLISTNCTLMTFIVPKSYRRGWDSNPRGETPLD